MISLQRFGQQSPIVVDDQDQVIKGNGTLEAAKRLGWTEIQIVRTDLSGDEAEAYAIADNKTGDLSEFNFEKLAGRLKHLEERGIDLESTGFQKFELEPLLQADWSAGSTEMPEDTTKGKHVLTFTDEEWAMVQKAIKGIRELETEYDTETDTAALVALAYGYNERGLVPF